MSWNDTLLNAGLPTLSGINVDILRPTSQNLGGGFTAGTIRVDNITQALPSGVEGGQILYVEVQGASCPAGSNSAVFTIPGGVIFKEGYAPLYGSTFGSVFEPRLIWDSTNNNFSTFQIFSQQLLLINQWHG
jgi:hypothetical protein